MSQDLYDSWKSHLAEKIHLFLLILEKNPLLFGAKKIDREICKRYYFPYYCVPVQYHTKVTVDSSAPPINIPKTPIYIFSSFKWYNLRYFSHLPMIYQGFHKKVLKLKKFKDFLRTFCQLFRIKDFSRTGH